MNGTLNTSRRLKLRIELNDMDKKLITIFLSVILIIPLFVAVMSNLEMFTFAPGDVGHWIGFWGSYLGATIGLAGVFFTTYLIIEKENEESRNAVKREIIKEAQKNIYDVYKIEAIYLNECVKYLEHLSLLLSKEINISEIYSIQSHYKNNLKKEEILFHTKINELKYSLYAIKYSGIDILHIEEFVGEKFSYMECISRAILKYQEVTREIVQQVDIKKRQDIIEQFIITKDNIENHPQKDINQLSCYLNKIKEDNDRYLTYLNKILSSPSLDDNVLIKFEKWQNDCKL